jgi:hypothetical protein
MVTVLHGYQMANTMQIYKNAISDSFAIGDPSSVVCAYAPNYPI